MYNLLFRLSHKVERGKKCVKACRTLVIFSASMAISPCGPVHMGRNYLGYRENISTSLQARSRLVMK